MKKWILLLTISACLFLTVGCISGGTTDSGIVEKPVVSTEENEEAGLVTLRCRIVKNADQALLLAGYGESAAAGGVYRLSVEGLPITYESGEESELIPGMLVEVVYDGTMMESYPACFGHAAGLRVLNGGFDDRCALYLSVLEDLWEVDAGLNSGITELGVDLSATSLPEAEQAAVAWAFGENHGLEPIRATYDELVAQGYITGDLLGGDAPEDARFWQWEKGCLFSITEQEMEGVYSLTPVTFDAMKWRSGLGAYIFSDCTAIQTALGVWSEYQVGSEVIS